MKAVRTPKRSICFQTASSAVSVAQIARLHATNAKMIFKRLGDPRYAHDPVLMLSPKEEPHLLPVEIVAENRVKLASGAG